MTETPIPPVENQPGAAPDPAPAPGPEPVKAARISGETPLPPKKRFLQRLFDPETRFGRGMRAFTRTLGAVVGLFALGLLSTYILLFQPLERRYSAAQTELAQAQTALESLQSELRQARGSLAGAEAERESAAADLARAQARVDVQRAGLKAMQVRLALAQKDSAAAAGAAKELETILGELKPALPAASAQTLDQVMALVKSDLNRGADLADQDLQRLLAELELVQ